MGEGLTADKARDATFLLTGAGMWVVLSITEISIYHIIKKYHTQWHNLKLNRVLTRGQHISRH